MIDEKIVEAIETLLNAFLPSTSSAKDVLVMPESYKVPRMRTIDEAYQYIKTYDENTSITKANLIKLARKKNLLVRMGAKNHIDLNKLDIVFSGEKTNDELQQGVIRPIKE